MTTGLILEGGGMRGIFTAGVLDYMMEQNLYVDNVLGVSAGACHGCSYVCGQKGRAYATSTDYLDNKEYCSLYSLYKTGDMFGADFLYHKIPEELYPVDNQAFKQRGIKFQAVVTNCKTGQAEYPQIRDMFEDIQYVRASSSLPFLARMVEINGNLYMDGGIADSIPLARSIAQGNEKNVVVLTRPRDYRKKKSKTAELASFRYGEFPEMVEALKRRAERYNEALDLIREEERAGRAFVIAPMGSLDISRTEKDEKKLRKAYLEGYYVTESYGKKLRAFMEKHSFSDTVKK